MVVGARVVVASVVVVVVVGVVVSAEVVRSSAPFLPLISLATCVSALGETVETGTAWGVTRPRPSGVKACAAPESGANLAPVNSRSGGPGTGGRLASNGWLGSSTFVPSDTETETETWVTVCGADVTPCSRGKAGGGAGCCPGGGLVVTVLGSNLFCGLAEPSLWLEPLPLSLLPSVLSKPSRFGTSSKLRDRFFLLSSS